MNINYRILADAMEYYKSIGYKEKHLPWIASSEAIDITLPKWAECMKCQVGYLIGSAEQSFLDEVIKNNLRGKFVACTPCFRKEPIIDELHSYFFMKVELFINDSVNRETLNTVISDAFGFYNKYIECEIIKTPEGFDIIDKKNKIELGSYGVREHKLTDKWIYGTGVALPRLQYAMDKL